MNTSSSSTERLLLYVSITFPVLLALLEPDSDHTWFMSNIYSVFPSSKCFAYYCLGQDGQYFVPHPFEAEGEYIISLRYYWQIDL